MRSPSLTRATRLINGRVVSTYNWQGHKVDVCDSARNVLLIIELFRDEELDSETKCQLLVRMLFFNPNEIISLHGENLGNLLIDVVWDACGLDISKDRRHADEYEEQVFSFDEDAGRIRASLLQCFGIDWNEAASSITYTDMCALLGCLLEADSETPFQQAVYYRTAKPPERTKTNGELCDAFEARRAHFALRNKDIDMESANDKAAAMFAASMRAARQGA